VLHFPRIPLLALGIALSACKPGTPTAAERPSTSPLSDDPLSLGPNDAQELRVARLVPTFGGIYVEDAHSVFVLTDLRTLDSAKAAWVRVVGSLPYGPTRAVPGRYSFVSLATWRNGLAPQVLPLRCGIGIDDRANLVSIGCPDSATITNARREAETLKVPNDAFAIRLEAPARAGSQTPRVP
jgi:hypothetical protein